jgi:hypothetical protein
LGASKAMDDRKNQSFYYFFQPTKGPKLHHGWWTRRRPTHSHSHGGQGGVNNGLVDASHSPTWVGCA